MRRPYSLALAGLLAFGATLSARAADTRVPANVIAIQVTGTVTVAHGKSMPAAPLADNDQLAAGDIVETAPASSVVLVLPNGTTVSLKEKSRLAITLVLQTPYAAPDLVVYDHTTPEPATSSTSLDLTWGELVAKVRKLLPGSDFSVKTPAGESGVKGTEFELAYAENAAGEANYRLSTASGLVVFAPVEGKKPVEAAAGWQVEMRGRRGKDGLKLAPAQVRPLPAEIRIRIQKQNQAAAAHAVRALQQAENRRDHPAVRPGESLEKPREQTRPDEPARKHPEPPEPGARKKRG